MSVGTIKAQGVEGEGGGKEKGRGMVKRVEESGESGNSGGVEGEEGGKEKGKRVEKKDGGEEDEYLF